MVSGLIVTTGDKTKHLLEIKLIIESDMRYGKTGKGRTRSVVMITY